MLASILHGGYNGGLTPPGPSTPERDRESDTALLVRVARGEALALKIIYDRYSARAMAIALRVLGARSEAEEVVQETFLEIWRRAAEFDSTRSDGNAAAWITVMARSRSVDRLRARGTRERARLQLVANEPATSSSPPSPLDDVEHQRAREQVSRSLSDLPAEQRSVIELAYWEGLTQREIAEKTGDALGTVKTRLRLGLEKLSALLGGLRS